LTYGGNGLRDVNRLQVVVKWRLWSIHKWAWRDRIWN